MKRIAECLSRLNGARVFGDLSALNLARVHTDTRSLQADDLFVALKGERFDAHDFLPQARSAGAAAVVAEHGLAQAGLPGVEVPDSRLALGELSRLWRETFELPLVAVTGSNGKTTVTQMLATILRTAVGDAAHATRGNLNNEIGVPLTLLGLRAYHRLAVVELGMNHPGEIASLAGLVQPTVALVNNAQREHQEFMGTVEAVARENGQVITALRPGGTAVFPSDDAYTAVWHELAKGAAVLSFSDTDTRADVHALSARWADGAWDVRLASPAGEQSCRLRVAGRHNVRNALAAAACALAAGVSLADIGRGLDAFEPVGGRSRALHVQLPGHVLTLIDDTYNANPDSVVAAIRVLAELPAPRVLVLGDMGEVGEQGLAFHLEVLRQAQASGIEAVHCAGDWMKQACEALKVAAEPVPTHWADVDAMAQALGPALAGSNAAARSVLVKGSRFMRMERVVAAVHASAAPQVGEKPKTEARDAA